MIERYFAERFGWSLEDTGKMLLKDLELYLGIDQSKKAPTMSFRDAVKLARSQINESNNR